MVSISYCITVHNEGSIYLEPLFKKLSKYIKPEDEIVVIDDFSDDESTTETIGKYLSILKVVKRKLEGDFADHKNFAKEQCTKQYIFFIDADENPHDNLLNTLKEILFNNHTVDLFYVPRVNVVPGITPQHIQKWGWIVNEKGYINYPDFQSRIIKNIPEITWQGKVHERLVGHTLHASLPIETEDYCLLHIKELKRQESQNAFYETI